MDFFRSQGHKRIHKWLHYFEVYDRHLSRFRGTDMTLVEIGVAGGGSLEMWRHYFGEKCKVIGIDVDPASSILAGQGIEIEIGDQGDPDFWEGFKARHPVVDVLIDDGGHRMQQLRTTFDQMLPAISPNGVYLAEDLHTSYWKPFGGGFRHKDSFIEFMKDGIDSLNAWFSRDPETFKKDAMTRSVHSIHFYASMVVVEKRVVVRPTHEIEPPELRTRKIALEAAAVRPTETQVAAGTRPDTAMDYIPLLKHLHRIRQPASYLEIGIRKGRSLQLAKCPAVGVDPGYDIEGVLPDRFRLFKLSSDDYFAGPALAESKPADGFDFVFIDGMHLFEFVLRDFINSERHCAPGAVIVIDDVYPLDEFMAYRNKRQIPPGRRLISNAWTGDVWKIVPTLRKYRPDLQLIPINCGPTGVLVVMNLDPHSTVLSARYEEILADPANDNAVLPPQTVIDRVDVAEPVAALDAIRAALSQRGSPG